MYEQVASMVFLAGLALVKLASKRGARSGRHKSLADLVTLHTSAHHMHMSRYPQSAQELPKTMRCSLVNHIISQLHVQSLLSLNAHRTLVYRAPN